MKTLLIAVNSKYIHSNLAIYYLKAYSSKYEDSIKIQEYTINQQLDKIFHSIYLEKPDLIALSCYIWNIEFIEKLCVEIRKVLPGVKIWLGGPEVSFDAKEYLNSHKEIDGIMLGEGEETFKDLLDYYYSDRDDTSLITDDKVSINNNLGKLESIKSIVFRETADKNFIYESYSNFNDIMLQESKSININNIIQTEPRPLLDFNIVPFPYKDLSNFDNKIIYYESSRGCPFSCSYCLSSVDKTMRLRDISLVKKELNFFLRHKVKQVKFIDRTFNCNKTHTRAVWKHIIENDNGITNFHFEIAADLLGDEEISLLGSMRSGLVQLEIGVQSTNPDTIKAINRKTNFKQISNNVLKVSEARNVHQHLDLIAGLPYEDYETFQMSFNEVYELRPDQLQLGFLKVLKGTPIVTNKEEYGLIFKSVPPYEVLTTRWLSFDDVLNLKLVEEMVEVYYNSGQFDTSIMFMEHFFDNYFELYKELGEYYRNNELLDLKYSRIRRYEILLEFMSDKLPELSGFKDILTYDLYLREKLKSRPSFAENEDKYKDIYGKIYSDDRLREKYLRTFDPNLNLGRAKRYFHVEFFSIDIRKSAKEGKYIQEPQLILFNYKDRNPLNNSGKTMIIDIDLE